MMIHLAVDLGSKRIGLAVSDEGEKFAFPLTVLPSQGLKKDIPAVREAARAETAQTVVMGLPLNMDGSEGPMAVKARKFAALLEQTGLQVVLHDERLSSYAAETLIREKNAAAGLRDRPTGKKPRASLDAQAAAVFLQNYLDELHAKPRGTGVPPVIPTGKTPTA